MFVIKGKQRVLDALTADVTENRTDSTDRTLEVNILQARGGFFFSVCFHHAVSNSCYIIWLFFNKRMSCLCLGT